MLPYFIAIPLIAHGLANLAGVFAPFTQNLQGFKDASWIFSAGLRYSSPAGRLFSLVWLASVLCLVASGAGILLHQSWWLPLAILGCGCSLVAIVPWLKAVPPGAYFGAVFDIAVIILLLSPLGASLSQAVL